MPSPFDSGPTSGDAEPKRWVHHDDRLPIDPDLAPGDPAEPSVAHHPVPHLRRGRERSLLVAIACGGALGALARYEIELAWPQVAGHLPLATLTINTSGALLLGLVLTILLERPAVRHLRPFLCVGAIGAFTTMSGFAVECDLLLQRHHLVLGATYAVLTTVLGLASSWLGMTAARRLAKSSSS